MSSPQQPPPPVVAYGWASTRQDGSPLITYTHTRGIGKRLMLFADMGRALAVRPIAEEMARRYRRPVYLVELVPNGVIHDTVDPPTPGPQTP